MDKPIPHGYPQWERFEAVLRDVLRQKIDLVIFGGDLALYEGDEATYRQIEVRLGRLPVDYIIQPGNHDDRSIFSKVFGRRYIFKQTMDMSVIHGNDTFLLIDSSAGIISDRQMNWIESMAYSHPQIRAYFIHHPVITGMNRYMDTNFALENAEVVCELFQRLPGNKSIFTGHYHMNHTITVDTVTQWITPAVYVQIDSESETFKEGAPNPGYRIIEVDAEALKTSANLLQRY